MSVHPCTHALHTYKPSILPYVQAYHYATTVHRIVMIDKRCDNYNKHLYLAKQ